ncbi:MAG: hypothetical protein DI535_23505 [Citrobacter freundii]|nr:MAG: hypothetical protein DI535_23505 [Citrobacter freundii]
MKFLLSCIFLITISGQVLTQQLQLINEDVSHPDSLIVFHAHLNHFTLTGEEDLHLFGLRLKNGVVTYTGNGRYLVRSLSKEPVEITVFRRDENTDTQKIISTTVYQVQDIGECKVQLVEQEDEKLSNGQVINQTSLELSFTNKNYNGPSSIAHFEISALQPDKSKLFSNVFVSGKFLGVDITNRLKKLKKGGRLLFSQVVMYTQEGSYQRLSDVSATYRKAG